MDSSKKSFPNKSADGTTTAQSNEGASIAGETLAMVANSATATAKQYGNHYVAEPAKDIGGLLQDYARSRPEVAAAWCFGIGFVIGWTLKP